MLSNYHYGFCKGKSTVDCIFLLSLITIVIIDKVITYEKKKLYCAFVDFRKAFDIVYRNGIWYILIQSNISSKFVKILQKYMRK